MPATRGTRNGTRHAIGGPSVFQPLIDVADSMSSRFADPTATEGMNAAATAADAVEALGKALQHVGQTITGNIEIDPRVAAYLEGLGDYVRKAVDPTRDVGDAVIRAHQDKLDWLANATPKHAKWDVSANGGPGGRPRRTG